SNNPDAVRTPKRLPDRERSHRMFPRSSIPTWPVLPNCNYLEEPALPLRVTTLLSSAHRQVAITRVLGADAVAASMLLLREQQPARLAAFPSLACDCPQNVPRPARVVR